MATETWQTTKLAELDIDHLLIRHEPLSPPRDRAADHGARRGLDHLGRRRQALSDASPPRTSTSATGGPPSRRSPGSRSGAPCACRPDLLRARDPAEIELDDKRDEIMPGLQPLQLHLQRRGSNETRSRVARYYSALGGPPDKVKIVSRDLGYRDRDGRARRDGLRPTGALAAHRRLPPHQHAARLSQQPRPLGGRVRREAGR